MIASPPIETAVDCPRPAAESVLQISVVMPPERDMTPIGPFLKARRTLTAGPPRPPILASSGERMPRQLAPMMRAPRRRASSTIRSEEHTSELQSRGHLVCRLLLEKKKKTLDIQIF